MRSGQAAVTANGVSRPYRGERSLPRPLRERSERPLPRVRSLPRGPYASEVSAFTQAAAVSITPINAGSCFALPPGTLNE